MLALRALLRAGRCALASALPVGPLIFYWSLDHVVGLTTGGGWGVGVECAHHFGDGVVLNAGNGRVGWCWT